MKWNVPAPLPLDGAELGELGVLGDPEFADPEAPAIRSAAVSVPLHCEHIQLDCVCEKKDFATSKALHLLSLS